MCLLLFMLGAIYRGISALELAGEGVMAAPLIWCMILQRNVYPRLRHPIGPSLAPLPVFMVIACLAGATAPIKLGKMRPDLAANWS